MDRDAIEELYAYTDFAWDRLTKTFESMSREQFVDPIPGSGWPSIRRAALHPIVAYDGWLNEDKWGLGLNESPLPDIEEWDQLYEKMPTWREVSAYRHAVRKTFLKVLNWSDEELFKKRTWELEFGPEELSPADILTNLVLHERGHHGDLHTLFHHFGIRSYFIDYRFFVSKPDEFIQDTEGSQGTQEG